MMSKEWSWIMSAQRGLVLDPELEHGMEASRCLLRLTTPLEHWSKANTADPSGAKKPTQHFALRA